MAMIKEFKASVLKFGTIAVYINLFGVIFSGLVFPVISSIFYPQPLWQGADTFIKSYHPIQTATFFCGYFLVVGSLLTFVTLYFLAGKAKRVWAFAAICVNVVFTAIVFINYIIQTTYVPYLASTNAPEAQYILVTFTMSNPGSFAWALEMYGWGGIGLSFIFMAFIFGKERYELTLKLLFWINGVASVTSALVTSSNMKWLFSPAGFAALIIWNLLVIVIDVVLIKYFSTVSLKKMVNELYD
jgi:hypothetical protein